jgi:hypothetical protein
LYWWSLIRANESFKEVKRVGLVRQEKKEIENRRGEKADKGQKTEAGKSDGWRQKAGKEYGKII